MKFSKDSATEEAKRDLAKRLNIAESEIKIVSAVDSDFPNMSLGAPVDGEASSMMIATGWIITLGANGKNYEYRADKYSLRLRGFNGTNYIVKS